MLEDVNHKPVRPRCSSALLSVLLLHTAKVTQAVLTGRSMAQGINSVPAALRPGTQALAFHTMRHLGWAQAIKQSLIKHPPASSLVNALFLVAMALLKRSIMDNNDLLIDESMPHYANHTIVNETVNAANSQTHLARYSRLLNASLRRFLRESDAILEPIQAQPEAHWNYPLWWIKQVQHDHPTAWEKILISGNQKPAMTLRVNQRRCTREQVLDAFKAIELPAAAVGSMGITVTTPAPVAQIPGFKEGWWSVQDAAAQLAAPLLEVKEGMRVLDACAAPGGKTAHLLELADIHLLALDTDPIRLTRVHQNLERLQLSASCRIQAANAAALDTWWDGKFFDAVLADVPCTASGIVSRHPDIRWLRRHSDLTQTARLQAEIVDALWQTVAPGGRLLYVTCSIFLIEGETQALAFAQRHQDAKRLKAPGQILPFSSYATTTLSHDGFFYALFAKRR